MVKEKLKNEKYLTIYFDDDKLVVVDVNNVNSDWEKILNQKQNIVRIETKEWSWNLLTGEIVFH